MSQTWVESTVHAALDILRDADELALNSEIDLRYAISTLSRAGNIDQTFHQLQDELIERSYACMKASPPSSSFAWRRVYTDACILRSLAYIREFSLTEDSGLALKCISTLDHAVVIAGAPGARRLDLVDDLIRTLQDHCFDRSDSISHSPYRIRSFRTTAIPSTASLDSALNPVPRLSHPPSLSIFLAQCSRHPFVLSGFIKHWPAMDEHPWSSSAYLRSVAGPGRVVPVEIGNDYRQDDWTQRMMPWDEFLDALESSESNLQQPVIYLAQHSLFLQFPSLRTDIEVPDYAYTSLPPPDDFPEYRPPGNNEQLVLNAWLGPGGTVSPAHTDPYYNFYAQVVGHKTIWLAPPDMSPSMYPYPPPSERTSDQPHNPAANNVNPSMSNTSQVDVFANKEGADREALFWENVPPRAMSVTLAPGDLLFFPPGWWHAMRSEETSFSVSMWF